MRNGPLMMMIFLFFFHQFLCYLFVYQLAPLDRLGSILGRFIGMGIASVLHCVVALLVSGLSIEVFSFFCLDSIIVAADADVNIIHLLPERHHKSLGFKREKRERRFLSRG
jgi:hypothetical protein